MASPADVHTFGNCLSGDQRCSSSTPQNYNNCNTISAINPTQTRSKTARRNPFRQPVFSAKQLRIPPRLYSAMYSDSPYGPCRVKPDQERL